MTHFHLSMPTISRHHHNHSHSSSTSSAGVSPPSEALSATSHKHYHSHPTHPHVETPYPVLEHASSLPPTASSSSHSPSFFDIHKPQHAHTIDVTKYTTAIPNPVHSVEDHITEFRYGHLVRQAKREAQRLSEHEAKSSNGAHRFKLDLERLSNSPIEEGVEEEREAWRERDQRAWEEEVRKREAARRSSMGRERAWTGGWTVEDAEEAGRGQ